MPILFVAGSMACRKVRAFRADRSSNELILLRSTIALLVNLGRPLTVCVVAIRDLKHRRRSTVAHRAIRRILVGSRFEPPSDSRPRSRFSRSPPTANRSHWPVHVSTGQLATRRRTQTPFRQIPQLENRCLCSHTRAPALQSARLRHCRQGTSAT
jgi:hypothetical protein